MYKYHNDMKKLLDISLLSSLILVLFSCDPIEPEYRYEHYFDDIYTVNKHTVSPEFSDSVIRISNMDKYPFVTGDRVHMTLRYYFDLSTMKMPLWEISHVTRKIETLPLTAHAGIDSAEYDAVFNKLHNYELASKFVKPVWIWKNRQNINISYFGVEEGASFVMAVRGINGDCLELDLYAKAKSNNEHTTTTLLAFDLSKAGDFLSEGQKNSIAGIDSLRTRIYFNRKVDGEVKRVDIIGGKFANPVK